MYEDCCEECIPEWAKDITITELFAKCRDLAQFTHRYHLEKIQKDLEITSKIVDGLCKLHNDFYHEDVFSALELNQEILDQRLFDLIDSILPFPKEPIKKVSLARFSEELKGLYLPAIKEAIETSDTVLSKLYNKGEKQNG